MATTTCNTPQLQDPCLRILIVADEVSPLLFAPAMILPTSSDVSFIGTFDGAYVGTSPSVEGTTVGLSTADVE